MVCVILSIHLSLPPRKFTEYSSKSSAEKDKSFFEDNFSTTSVALDNLHDQMKSLSLRLNSSENTVKSRE